MVASVLCIVFGSLILLSSLFGFLGLTPRSQAPQDGAEAFGYLLGQIFFTLLGAYLLYRGIQRLRRGQ